MLGLIVMTLPLGFAVGLSTVALAHAETTRAQASARRGRRF